MGELLLDCKGVYIIATEPAGDPDQEAADAVIALIAAIGDVEYTTESQAKILAARNAYDALTEGQQALVTNYDVLTAAEAAFTLAGNEAAFNEFKDETAIAAAAFATDNDLGDAAQAVIAAGVETITAQVYDENKSLEENKDAITLLYNTTVFNALKEDAKDYFDTLALEGDSEACAALIAQAKADVDAAPYDDTKDLSGNMGTLSAIATQLVADLAAQREADQQGAVGEVIALIDAIGDVAYTAESKAKIDAARAAYDALTEDQQALVTNAQTLTDAEESFAALREAALPEKLTVEGVSRTPFSFYYNGEQQQPATVTVTNSIGEVLTEDVDYTVTYPESIEPGYYMVRVEGVGDYCGVIRKGYTIKEEAVSISVSRTVTTLIANGEQQQPTVTVTNAAGDVLTEGEDYTVTYPASVEPGTYLLCVTGTGYYTGSIRKAYVIR